MAPSAHTGPGETVADGHRVALFRRPVYCISVAFPLFDRFFNSRQGYRGAYFRSPYEGLEANGVLMCGPFRPSSLPLTCPQAVVTRLGTPSFAHIEFGEGVADRAKWILSPMSRRISAGVG